MSRDANHKPAGMYSQRLPERYSHTSIKRAERGFILLITLLFLFVITLIAVSGSQDMILENKMQNNMKNYFRVFSRAEFGMQQAILAQEGDPIIIPDSPISLKVTTKMISTDECDNPTLDITAIAKNQFSTVILNTRAIFAHSPREEGCEKIMRHQVLWWHAG